MRQKFKIELRVQLQMRWRCGDLKEKRSRRAYPLRASRASKGRKVKREELLGRAPDIFIFERKGLLKNSLGKGFISLSFTGGRIRTVNLRQSRYGRLSFFIRKKGIQIWKKPRQTFLSK